MTSSLVGSEMCIRDSSFRKASCLRADEDRLPPGPEVFAACLAESPFCTVSYTHLTLPTICSV
eukprot:3316679-Prorocentrum_lima.AAC.1